MLGVVYTPRELAAAMARLVLEPMLRTRSSRTILELRVCDPAVGEGVFLHAVIDVVAAALAAAWRAEGHATDLHVARELVATTCVAGVDVDARAISLARERLGGSRLALQVADALTIDWAAAFPDVARRGGFDVVLGNPPYVRQEWIGAARKEALRHFACFDGAADLYVYFVELAHRMLHPHGRYGLLIPNKWLTAAYGRNLRGYLAEKASVEGVLDLSRMPVFADAEAFPCIVWGSNTPTPERASPTVRAGRLDRDAGIPERLGTLGEAQDRGLLGAEPWHIDSARDRALVDRLLARGRPLESMLVARPARGVVTGCNRAFVVDRATRDAMIAADASATAIVRPFLKGRDVRRWLPGPIDRWILLVDRGVELDDLPPPVAAHLARFRAELEPRPREHTGTWRGRKPGSYRWHELQDPVGDLAGSLTPRLVYQDIQTGPACSLVEGGVVPDTTVWILPSQDRYLHAVLGSRVYGWFARRRFPPALNGSVRPKLEYMRAFPVPMPSDTQRAAIDRLVGERLELEARTRNGDDRAARTGRELEAAIDATMFDIYELDASDRALVADAS